MTIEEALAGVVKREGGFVDRAQDHGGPTKYGVTLATLGAWRRKPVTKDDVAALTVEEAGQILYQFAAPLAWIADPALFGAVVDAAVMSSVERAVELLQGALEIPVDGYAGPITRAAVVAKGGRGLRTRFAMERAFFYGRIVERDPTQAEFIEGWLVRALSFLEQ